MTNNEWKNEIVEHLMAAEKLLSEKSLTVMSPSDRKTLIINIERLVTVEEQIDMMD